MRACLAPTTTTKCSFGLLLGSTGNWPWTHSSTCLLLDSKVSLMFLIQVPTQNRRKEHDHIVLFSSWNDSHACQLLSRQKCISKGHLKEERKKIRQELSLWAILYHICALANEALERQMRLSGICFINLKGIVTFRDKPPVINTYYSPLGKWHRSHHFTGEEARFLLTV